jgi:hypothetical protein
MEGSDRQGFNGVESLCGGGGGKLPGIAEWPAHPLIKKRMLP